MENTLIYLDFIREKGRQVSEINPGSDEMALNINDALECLELLKKNDVEILGGDIFSEDDGRLIYAYQLWGAEYHYLNWWCNRLDNENDIEYLNRCYVVAKEGIINANKIAEQFNKRCLIVFVT